MLFVCAKNRKKALTTKIGNITLACSDKYLKMGNARLAAAIVFSI